MKYKNQPGEEVLRFLREDLPSYYHYSTSLMRQKDNKGTIYVRIRIEGWSGIRAEYRRPSPFDKSFVITTRLEPVLDSIKG
jgi:hypothetical protein